MIKQRDFLLVPFPFSDQSGQKVRPVIVISNDQFNASSEDILVVGVTSRISKDHYTILLSQSNFEEGILRESCCIKVENLLKIDKKLVIKTVGRITTATFEELVRILRSIIE